MPSELDMNAYHQEGIDPGEHKVFSIPPTIHSFNQRFEGTGDFGKQQSDTFDQRFQGQDDLPIAFSGDTLDRTRTDLVDRIPPWPGDNTTGLGSGGATFSYPVYKEQRDLDLYQPIGNSKLPYQEELHPYLKALRDAGVSHIENMSQSLKDSLVDLIKHPENLAGTGELGATIPKGLFMPKNIDKEALDLIHNEPSSWIPWLKDSINKGMSVRDMAKDLSVPETNVQVLVNRFKDILGQSSKDVSNIDKIRSMTLEGKTYSEVADELGISRKTVSSQLNKLRKAGEDIPSNLDKNRPSADPELDKAIIKGRSEGKSFTQIANENKQPRGSIARRYYTSLRKPDEKITK